MRADERVDEEDAMDWLDFRPWSHEVEKFCRTLLEDASRHPRSPHRDPVHADPRSQLQQYREDCHFLLELSKHPAKDQSELR